MGVGLRILEADDLVVGVEWDALQGALKGCEQGGREFSRCEGEQLLLELGFPGLQFGPGVGGAGLEAFEQWAIESGRAEAPELGFER